MTGGAGFLGSHLCEHLLDRGVEGTTVAVQHHGNGSDGIDDALAQAGERRLDFSSIRFSLSAGEALPESVGNAWRARFGVDILDLLARLGEQGIATYAADGTWLGWRTKGEDGSTVTYERA